MNREQALLNMKSALCEALRADLDEACRKIDRQQAVIASLHDELRELRAKQPREWWQDVDEDYEQRSKDEDRCVLSDSDENRCDKVSKQEVSKQEVSKQEAGTTSIRFSLDVDDLADKTNQNKTQTTENLDN